MSYVLYAWMHALSGLVVSYLLTRNILMQEQLRDI